MRSLLGEIKRIGGVECYAFSNYGSLYKEIEHKLELSRFLDWRFVSCNIGTRKDNIRTLNENATAVVVCRVVGNDSVGNCTARIFADE